jgi:predicted amino acid dehydrogenase
MPPRSCQTPWFTFLVHPRDVEDACRSGPGAFLRHYSADEEQFRRKLHGIPPLVLADIRFGFDAVRGELISVSRLPQELSGADGAQAVLAAVEVALRRGSEVIGLGALTSPATGGGLMLLAHLPRGVTLTNGNAYTAAVVRQNVIEASEVLGLGREARVAVVGCTGSVGAPASHLLAEAGFQLVLVGRSVRRAATLLSELAGPAAVFAEGLAALWDTDIVVLLTSDPSARLAPELLRPGSVVIDCAQPANVPTSRYEEFRRQRVTVVEGGVVRIPDYTCGHSFGLGGDEETFACLAETYLFAREGIREHSVGRPSADLARKMERIARRRGVQPRPLAPALEAAPPPSAELGIDSANDIAMKRRFDHVSNL